MFGARQKNDPGYSAREAATAALSKEIYQNGLREMALKLAVQTHSSTTADAIVAAAKTYYKFLYGTK